MTRTTRWGTVISSSGRDEISTSARKPGKQSVGIERQEIIED
jgi:hypothetical protein